MADITAARLNNLQSRIALILGIGSGSSGYGQTLASSQVAASSIVASSDINNIFTDMVKARIHQVGIAETGIRQVIEDLNIIAEETSGTITDAGVTGTDIEGTLKGIADYESLMNSIESDKLLLHSSQAALEPKLTSTRTATWNGLIFHTLTVTFSNADERRHFFNAGGEIRISTNNTNPSTSKGLDWAALCSEVGIVRFSRVQTFAGNSGQGYFIGDDGMTSSYQTVYSKVGAGTYSGIYAGNLYTIKARETSSSVIEFRIEFNDVVVDNNVDNNVDGALTSTVQQYRAVGPNSITSVSPTYFTSTALSGFNVPVDNTIPTYILSSNKNAVNEGESFTLTLTTTNVPDTTTVPYTITGVRISDIGNASLTGNFVINNSTATLTYTATADATTEDTEVMTLTLNNGKAAANITINDTSRSVLSYTYSPQWINEFGGTFLANIPTSTALDIGAMIADNLYNNTGSWLNTNNETVYALNRKPDAAGLAYWTREYYNNYFQSAGLTITDPAATGFTKTFFTYMASQTNAIPFTVDGVALGPTLTDAARILLATKPAIVGDGFGDFGDRGSATGIAPSPVAPSADFAFTVSGGAINFNQSGAVTQSITVACQFGSGSVTVEELTRPSQIAVAVSTSSKTSYSINYPSVQTDAKASITNAISAGQTQLYTLTIHNTQDGTWTGSFAIKESTGVGQLINRAWSGTFGATASVVTGQQLFTTPGTTSWTAPQGVTSVSVVAIGAGGASGSGSGGGGGAGGGLAWKNNITVTPGQAYDVSVGAGGVGLFNASSTPGASGGNSWFINLQTLGAHGGQTHPTASNAHDGGQGGNFEFTGTGGGGKGGDGGTGGASNAGGGGGGAGGYSGNGGNGGGTLGSVTAGAGGAGGGGATIIQGNNQAGGGGGVGVFGEGTSGAAGLTQNGEQGGQGGSGGISGGDGSHNANLDSSGGAYGGGPGAQGAGGQAYNGANGAVRIIWPGDARQFPSTRTADE